MLENWNGNALTINEHRNVYALTKPAQVGAFAFDSGPIPRLLSTTAWSTRRRSDVRDPFGYASAALGYPLALAPHASAHIGLAMPLSGQASAPDLHGLSAQTWMERAERAVART